MESETNQCKVASGSTYDYYRKDCLLPFKGLFRQTATACINAAQAHYDASSGLDGYDADRQLILAATLEGMAGSANDFLGNCGLAISQLQSIITLLKSIINDPAVGDLLTPAKKELALAKTLEGEAKLLGC